MHNDLRFAPTYMLLRSNSGTDIDNLVAYALPGGPRPFSASNYTGMSVTTMI